MNNGELENSDNKENSEDTVPPEVNTSEEPQTKPEEVSPVPPEEPEPDQTSPVPPAEPEPDQTSPVPTTETEPTLRKRLPVWTKMVILFSIIGIIITVFIVTGFGGQLPSSQPNPTPTATNNQTAQPEEDKKTISQNTAELFMQVLMEDVKNQLGEETANRIQVSTGTSDKDNNDEPAKVALISLTGFPPDFNVNQNIDYIQTVLNLVNENESTNWVLTKADPSTFDGNVVVGVAKMWEDTENPINPAIVEVSYTKNSETNEIEIVVSATVY